MTTQMQQDNRKLAEQARRIEPLRMSKAQPYERVVCEWAILVAGMLAKRVGEELHMENLPLPLGYVVRKGASPDGKQFGIFLNKLTESGEEYAVNEKDPAVDVCIAFYRDMKGGLGKKVEEAYRQRVKEFEEAKDFLKAAYEYGASAWCDETPDASTSAATLTRWDILGEQK